MTAYYNEIDPKAAAWLRELIKAGHIAPGFVDERSIEDVLPAELMGYTQCHFFAGIGVWSYALRRAGWPDDRPVWTGSCPCQPFSAAGKGAGFADERHLWPAWFHLISQCRPPVVFGEQVASKDAGPWLDLVHDDLEAVGHALGAVAFPSAGVGAPHIRDRLYWLAGVTLGDTGSARLEGHAGHDSTAGWSRSAGPVATAGLSGGMADHSSGGRREEHAHAGGCSVGDRSQGFAAGFVHGGRTDGLVHADGWHASAEREQRGWEQRQQPQDRGRVRMAPGATLDADSGAGPTNGLWRDADWLFCRDGKWRPVEPRTFPLAHGAAARVGRLRGYGNAINAEAAKAFIEAVMEAA